MKRNLIKHTAFLTILMLANQMLSQELEEVVVSIQGRTVPIRLPDSDLESRIAPERIVAQRVKAKIVEALVREHNVQVERNVLDRVSEVYISSAGLDSQAIAKLSSKLRNLASALRNVHIMKRDAEDVFKEMLANEMSTKEWGHFVQIYDSAEKIEELERSIPTTRADLIAQSEAQIRKDLELWLLFQHISKGKQFVVPDGYIEEKVGQGISPSEAKRQFRVERLRGWWVEEVETFDIMVPAKYSAALKFIRELPRPGFPPDVVKVLEDTFQQ